MVGSTPAIGQDGHVFITGRLKEIIVLANGENVPLVDLEAAIAADPVFEQVMVLGEGKPYLSALVVLNGERLDELLARLGLSGSLPTVLEDDMLTATLLERIAKQMQQFPGYARVRRVAVSPEPWRVENGMMTPTFKIKRARVMEACKSLTESLYAGH
jgi:long-chain acyl-CoA synthetase